MGNKKLFFHNLQTNFHHILIDAALFLLLYNVITMILKSSFSLGILNRDINIGDNLLLSSLTLCIELLMIGCLVIANQIVDNSIRKVLAALLYIVGFLVLFFVCKLNFIDLAIYFLTIVWVESIIFNDYDSITMI